MAREGYFGLGQGQNGTKQLTDMPSSKSNGTADLITVPSVRGIKKGKGWESGTLEEEVGL